MKKEYIKAPYLIVILLFFEVAYTQNCKLENITDTDGSDISVTKPKLITSGMSSGDYIFARGVTTGRGASLELDIRSPKQFSIGSDCKIAFSTSNGHRIALKFSEFKVAYYTKVADHSSYWKLNVKVPVDSSQIHAITTTKITNLQWHTTKDSIQKKLKRTHYKNLVKLLHCIKKDAQKESINNEESPNYKREQQLNASQSTTPTSSTESEPLKMPKTPSTPLLKSNKELQIENSIIIPGKEKGSD